MRNNAYRRCINPRSHSTHAYCASVFPARLYHNFYQNRGNLRSHSNPPCTAHLKLSVCSVDSGTCTQNDGFKSRTSVYELLSRERETNAHRQYIRGAAVQP
ncbi:hypothetical protein WN55_02959 [Dufourea novaeangliae]|uniref:Uncharacterized protein n=1 Tax=Dufourea novaeangliae TaxID=178035 RepID=A0A154PIN8_DUFNO|nr:hypothetical protein WN55_02959 [Dufourea novaeangliae]